MNQLIMKEELDKAFGWRKMATTTIKKIAFTEMKKLKCRKTLVATDNHTRVICTSTKSNSKSAFKNPKVLKSMQKVSE